MKATILGMIAFVSGLILTILVTYFYPTVGLKIITISIMVGGISVAIAGIPNLVCDNERWF